MVAFADAQPARIAHLHYPELTEDPIGACERALCAVGADGGPPFALRAQAFLERQRKGARAAPPAVYDDFGYEHEQVLSTPEVAAYCRRFGVQPERQRRTGT